MVPLSFTEQCTPVPPISPAVCIRRRGISGSLEHRKTPKRGFRGISGIRHEASQAVDALLAKLRLGHVAAMRGRCGC